MSHLRFLAGGGEMGELIRGHRWSDTPMGDPAGWPQSLRTALRLLLNTGHPMYIFWGPDSLCFYNDAYRASLGPERHPGSLGQPGRAVWAEIWHIIGPQIEQVLGGGEATWHENQPVPTTRHGRREDVYWTYSYGPVDDEDAPHGVGGVLVVCTETTQQVALTRRLAQSEERLEQALAAGRGIGTWDWDVVNDRVVADARFARLYGVDPAQAAAGAPIDEFFRHVHPDDLPPLRGHVARALATGERFSQEYRLVDAAGGTRWVVAEGRCERSADGRPLRFPGVSFDTTQRKQVEDALRELNAELERKVIERSLERGRTWQMSPELLGVLAEDGRFEASNPAWGANLGWSEAEVERTRFFDFVHPDDLDDTRRYWQDAITRRLPALRFENRCRAKGGAFRWLSWVAVPDGGKVYCSARDITDDKERGHALVRAENALRQSQKMEAVGQLTGGLAHDFNNLLAAIGGSLEVVRRLVAAGRVGDTDRYLNMAKGGVDRAAALTHRLLSFSRQQTLDPKATDTNRLVADMEELIRRTVGPAVQVDVVAAPDLWTTLVDPHQLENALLNLCINARDAMPTGGQLTVQTSNQSLGEHSAGERDMAAGDYVALAVTDTGTGMTPEIAAKAFDPFFTTKPLGAGTGLGLSMTYGFARQSGGQARIHSVFGEGTTVRLYLPRHSAPAESPAEARAPAATVRAAHGEAILVIDDEPTLRALIVDELADAGYAMTDAPDGPAALRLLQGGAAVDLLVTDVGLPGGMNGRQVADAARRLRPGLKVLFITGFAANVVGHDALEEGLFVMTKPFEMEALARKVREILAQGGGTPAPPTTP